MNYCPKCGSPVRVKSYKVHTHKRDDKVNKSIHIEALLDNIRSANNVGSIFRTADGVDLRHLYLCGLTPAPENPNISKTALGAEKQIPWTQSWNSLQTVKEKKDRGYLILSLENSPDSVSLYDMVPDINQPILVIVGNEITGIDPDILNTSDLHIHIPMKNFKNSLNVAVAFGIAVYTLTFGQQKRNAAF